MFWRRTTPADSAPSASSDAPSAKERTAALLREVRAIEFQTARLVDRHVAGSYQSVFKGRGVAFSEVRAYEPGDDVRTIDWNVTARTGEPHVKQFTEERELTVMLVVDLSRSLDLGSKGEDKRTLVARLVATFAFSAIRNGDRVGLIGFTDEVEVFVPPRSGRKHVLAVISRILQHEPKGRGTRVDVALEYFARLGRSQAVVVVVSDFLQSEPMGRGGEALRAHEREAAARAARARFERALKVVRRRNDLIPVRVEDPLELAMPALGIIDVEDLEGPGSGATHTVDLSRRRAAHYQARAAAERAQLDDLLARMRIDALSVRCGAPWQEPLVRYFERRARGGGSSRMGAKRP